MNRIVSARCWCNHNAWQLQSKSARGDVYYDGANINAMAKAWRTDGRGRQMKAKPIQIMLEDIKMNKEELTP